MSAPHKKIALIVEGHGEDQAARELVRRILKRLDPNSLIEVLKPHRLPRTKMTNEREFGRAIKLASMRIAENGAILVLLDSDDDCPVEISAIILKQAKIERSDLTIKVVAAHREFESWFLASIESLRGRRGIPDDAVTPNDPEEVRGAKKWLADRMGKNRTYSPTIDQPAFASIMNLDLAFQNSRSFRKFYNDVESIYKSLID